MPIHTIIHSARGQHSSSDRLHFIDLATGTHIREHKSQMTQLGAIRKLVAMTTLVSHPALLLSFGVHGLQPLSRRVWTGRPVTTHHTGTYMYKHASQKYRPGSVASDTQVALSSKLPDPSTFTLQLSVPTPEDLEEVGALLAALATPPDVLFLDGDLGCGKTTLARGFVVCKLGLDNDDDQTLRVTSPTYLLSNTYSYQDEYTAKQQEIHHMDLYRLTGTSPINFEPLQLDHVFENCISLVEWPSRLESQPQLLPSNAHRLDVTISIVPQSNTRLMTLMAPLGSTWNERLQNLLDEGMLDDLLCEE